MRATRIVPLVAIAAAAPLAAAVGQATGEQRVTATHACAAADLTIATANTGGSGAGTLELGIILHNVSKSACSMTGYPGLGLLASNEKAIKGYAAFDHTRTPHKVTVPKNGEAHFLLRYSDVPQGGETRCARSSYLLVTPPDRRVSAEARVSIAPCNKGRMLVTPVMAGGI